MVIAPFLNAPAHVQGHILAALLIIALSPVQFFVLRKGSLAHRTLGYVWISAMAFLAISSFFIRSTLPWSYHGFSVIHLLSILALFTIVRAVRAARQHRIAVHRKALIILTINFLIAGAFTLLPSRIMGRILFGLG